MGRVPCTWWRSVAALRSVPHRFIFPTTRLGAESQFSDFLDGLGPGQLVGRQTLATPPMGECWGDWGGPCCARGWGRGMLRVPHVHQPRDPSWQLPSLLGTCWGRAWLAATPVLLLFLDSASTPTAPRAPPGACPVSCLGTGGPCSSMTQPHQPPAPFLVGQEGKEGGSWTPLSCPQGVTVMPGSDHGTPEPCAITSFPSLAPRAALGQA